MEAGIHVGGLPSSYTSACLERGHVVKRTRAASSCVRSYLLKSQSAGGPIDCLASRYSGTNRFGEKDPTGCGQQRGSLHAMLRGLFHFVDWMESGDGNEGEKEFAENRAAMPLEGKSNLGSQAHLQPPPMASRSSKSTLYTLMTTLPLSTSLIYVRPASLSGSTQTPADNPRIRHLRPQNGPQRRVDGHLGTALLSSISGGLRASDLRHSQTSKEP